MSLEVVDLSSKARDEAEIGSGPEPAKGSATEPGNAALKSAA